MLPSTDSRPVMKAAVGFSSPSNSALNVSGLAVRVTSASSSPARAPLASFQAPANYRYANYAATAAVPMPAHAGLAHLAYPAPAPVSVPVPVPARYLPVNGSHGHMGHGSLVAPAPATNTRFSSYN